ncbi:MAG TPA: hypothetical protein VGO92_06095, partial [Acidimicrobiales bacterium]|nr:hypothetical protein [Acidimicrobiales bacterium]
MPRVPNISPGMCTRGRTLGAALLSPDGAQVAFSTSVNGVPSIMAVPTGAGAEPAPEQAAVVDPSPGPFAWTPDGAALVFASADRLIRTPLTGGPGQVIVQHADRLSAPAVSPDGTRVAY